MAVCYRALVRVVCCCHQATMVHVLFLVSTPPHLRASENLQFKPRVKFAVITDHRSRHARPAKFLWRAYLKKEDYPATEGFDSEREVWWWMMLICWCSGGEGDASCGLRFSSTCHPSFLFRSHGGEELQDSVESRCSADGLTCAAHSEESGPSGKGDVPVSTDSAGRHQKNRRYPAFPGMPPADEATDPITRTSMPCSQSQPSQ